MEARVQAACAGMSAALEALRESRDASFPLPERALVSAAAGQVKLEASKLALLSSGEGRQPPEEQLTPLVACLQRAVCALCTVLTGAAACGGPTLRAAVGGAARSVVDAAAALVRCAAPGGGGPGAVQRAGVLLAACDEAARVPLTNRIAIGREVTKVLRQLQDCVRELGEAAGSDEAQEAKPEEGAGGAPEAPPPGLEGPNGAAVPAAEGAEGSEPEGSSDELFGGGELSAGEAAVARAVQHLLARAASLVRALARALVAAGGAAEAAEGVEAWESCRFHLAQLLAAADELAAGAMCPPLDRAELESAAGAVATGCELLAEECPAAADEEPQGLEVGGSGAGAELREAVAAVAQAQQGLLRSLQRAQLAD